MRWIALLLTVFVSTAQAQDALTRCLQKKVEGIVQINTLGPKEGFKQVYDIRLLQPLDHTQPDKGTLEQRIYLYYKSRRKPVVFVTEGYNLNDRKYELCDLLDANQISVEYRFYGKSGSDDIKWNYLNNTQAANDLHRIKTMFDDVFQKEWVSTGISKGGTTTMIYKALYPEDVSVAVNYVGPLPLAQEDNRMDIHIQNIGSDSCRQKLVQFQRLALLRRDALLPRFKSFAEENEMSFSIGLGAAFEYAVFEYTFSFWQFAHSCTSIPDETASDEEIFTHLNEVVGFDFYSDAVYDFFGNAFFQFMGENGYYGFLHDHLDDLIRFVPDPTNLAFTPKDVPIEYNGDFMADINSRLQDVGNQMIHIHGEYDPWGAVGFVPPADQDALLIVQPRGGHTTRIGTLDAELQNEVFNHLDRWLKTRVKRKTDTGQPTP